MTGNVELPDVACKHGRVHERAMFLRFHVGEVTAPDGTEYELATGNDGSPLVLEHKTFRAWSIGWPELFAMALAAGLGKGTKTIEAKPEEVTE